MKHRELSHKVKFGCSKDNTLAFLDFLDWDRSIHDWIGKPPLPLTIMLCTIVNIYIYIYINLRPTHPYSWKGRHSPAIQNQEKGSIVS